MQDKKDKFDDNYEAYYIAKKSSSPNGKMGWLSVTLIIVSILAFVIAFWVGLFATGVSEYAVNLPEKTFYLVEMAKYDNEKEAAQKADENMRLGGGGYIFNDGMFRVISTAFISESDCDSVIARLNRDGVICSKYKLLFSAVKINNFDSFELAKQVGEYIAYPMTTLYNELYDMSRKLDKGEMTESMTLLKLNYLIDELENRRIKLDEIVTTKKTALVIAIKSEYTNIIATLREGIEQTQKTAASRIKHTFIKLLHKYSMFIASLS